MTLLTPQCTNVDSPGYCLTSFLRACPDSRSLEIRLMNDRGDALGALLFTHGGERCVVSFLVSDDLAGDIMQAVKSAHQFIDTTPPPRQIDMRAAPEETP